MTVLSFRTLFCPSRTEEFITNIPKITTLRSDICVIMADLHFSTAETNKRL